MSGSARAPGKVVLSGAYSVLAGAPALVAAVDRYVVADASQPPTLVTDEVREAIRRGHLTGAVAFDATALRDGDRKLGLGSSAAILVASLAATSDAEDAVLAEALFEPALTIHRAAQGGGSGLDVAAACFGGVLHGQLRRGESGLAVRPHPLPDSAFVEVWACPTAASTRGMLAAVRALAERDPAGHDELLLRAAAGAGRAANARGVDVLIAALASQRDALAELGDLAGVPIVTAEVRELGLVAAGVGACFLPSGAGGGDIALHVASGPSGPDFRARASAAGLWHVSVQVGARGVHRV